MSEKKKTSADILEDMANAVGAALGEDPKRVKEELFGGGPVQEFNPYNFLTDLTPEDFEASKRRFAEIPALFQEGLAADFDLWLARYPSTSGEFIAGMLAGLLLWRDLLMTSQTPLAPDLANVATGFTHITFTKLTGGDGDAFYAPPPRVDIIDPRDAEDGGPS